MQDVLRSIYDSLHIRNLLNQENNFQKNFVPQAKLSIVGLGKVAYHHVQAMSEMSPNVGLKAAIVPQDFTCIHEEMLIRGSHPELQALSFEAGRKLIRTLQKIPSDSALIFCLSGGGSALAEIPAPGLDESFLVAVNSHLLKSGCPIMEMNAIRMALSALKNGGALCGLPGRGEVYLSVLSDIPTDDWRAVSSSPVIYRELDVRRVRESAERWLPENLARTVTNYLDSTDYKSLQEVKAQAGERCKLNCQLVADGKRALELVAGQFKGGHTFNLGVMSCSFGEAIECHLQALKQIPSGPFALISGGECPVTITLPSPGRGGRNTHFALAMTEKIFYENVLRLSSKELQSWWVASLATDGRDGNCACAGACFRGDMVSSARPEEFLRKFDSYNFFRPDALLLFEEYQSNLMDVRIISGFKK